MNLRYARYRVLAENIFIVDYNNMVLKHLTEVINRLNQIDQNRKIIFVNTRNNIITNTVEAENYNTRPVNYNSLCAGLMTAAHNNPQINWEMEHI